MAQDRGGRAGARTGGQGRVEVNKKSGGGQAPRPVNHIHTPTRPPIPRPFHHLRHNPHTPAPCRPSPKYPVITVVL